jgi:hypothetical protein
MMNRRRTLGVASLVLLSGLSGCVFGEESEPPVLTVELYWQYDERTRHNESCDSVPVAATEWRLLDSDGEEIAELSKDKMECDNTVNFLDLDPGDYKLEVGGYNEAGDKAWEATCPVWVDRFDRLFECTINELDP